MEQSIYKNQAATAQTLDDQRPSSADYLNYLQTHKPTDQAPTSNGKVLFLTADENMMRIREIVEQIKDANVPVLITGESGTGKEVIARAIHNASNRNDKPFVAVNCAALPSNLLENELYGHEKGSFTGAFQKHTGKFEQADGGTLLLDEVTEMDQGLQAKLLRALQEKEIERIGGNAPIKVNTRIIATTNRDITQIVKQGTLRQDLYYRLYVINLEIPPLRERPKDIDLLANHFLSQYREQYGKHSLEFNVDAINKLRSHYWPGNVRELQNIVQRSVLLASNNMIMAQDVPLEVETSSQSLEWVTTLPVGRPLKDLETHFILSTLKHHEGNRTHAAKTLGISLRTLRNKINEYTGDGFEVTAPTTGRG